jgi:hypothetical protein
VKAVTAEAARVRVPSSPPFLFNKLGGFNSNHQEHKKGALRAQMAEFRKSKQIAKERAGADLNVFRMSNIEHFPAVEGYIIGK